MSGLGFEGLRNYYRTLRVAGAISIAAVGIGGFFISKNLINKQQDIKKMEWIADHHWLYGNHNGQFDYEEKLGIIRDLGVKYVPKNISFDDARKYIALYKRSNISP